MLYLRLLEGKYFKSLFYFKLSSYLSHCSLLEHYNSAATRFKINMVHHLTLSVRPVVIFSTRQYFLTPISPHFINVTESNESWNSKVQITTYAVIQSPLPGIFTLLITFCTSVPFQLKHSFKLVLTSRYCDRDKMNVYVIELCERNELADRI